MISHVVLPYFDPARVGWEALSCFDPPTPDGSEVEVAVFGPEGLARALGKARSATELWGTAGNVLDDRGGLVVQVSSLGQVQQLAVLAFGQAGATHALRVRADEALAWTALPHPNQPVAVARGERWILPVDAGSQEALKRWLQDAHGLPGSAQEAIWSVLRRPSLDARLAILERMTLGAAQPAVGSATWAQGEAVPPKKAGGLWTHPDWLRGTQGLTVATLSVVILVIISVLWYLWPAGTDSGVSDGPEGAQPASAEMAPGSQATPTSAAATPAELWKARLEKLKEAARGKEAKIGALTHDVEGAQSAADLASREKGYLLARLLLVQSGTPVEALGGNDGLLAKLEQAGAEGTLPGDWRSSLLYFQLQQAPCSDPLLSTIVSGTAPSNPQAPARAPAGQPPEPCVTMGSTGDDLLFDGLVSWLSQPTSTTTASSKPAPTQPSTTKPPTTRPATTKPPTTMPATTKPATTMPATTTTAETSPPATTTAETPQQATQPPAEGSTTPP